MTSKEVTLLDSMLTVSIRVRLKHIFQFSRRPANFGPKFGDVDPFMSKGLKLHHNQ